MIIFQYGADLKPETIDLEVVTPHDVPEVVTKPAETKQCRPHRWIWNNRRLLICALVPLILIPIPLTHPSPVSLE